ncbi:MAG: DUF5689 domain-containing protein [Weeksellaceae bacterium]|jgi:hypothetical protein|nr:DUF5689 domain-containing protein [Weeksellaceae bacterium]
MNTIKKIQFTLMAALMLFSINSCVEDDDWSIPPMATCNDTWQTNLSLEELYSMVNTANGQILSFDEEKIIEGYVVSSDSTGNFFKTVSIQNSISDPTYGVQVEMDKTNLFRNFPLGSKIRVNLKGLNVGYDRGMLKVGENYVDNYGNTRVGRMAEFRVKDHVKLSCNDFQNIVPVEFNNFTELFNNGVFNTLVTIHNVQFADSELGTTYSDVVGQQTVDKKLVDLDGKNLKLRNSNYATFAGEMVPQGSGSITVVVSAYDTNNNGGITPSEYQVYIRDTNDVKFDNPRIGGGGEEPEPGTYEYFACLNENFESYSVDFENFTKYENIAKVGTRKWRITEFSNNKYIQATAFGSSTSMVSYFVVPVDFTNADSFSFKTKDGYNNGDPLKVFYSTNYIPGGDNTNATLNNITSSFTISTGNTNTYGADFIDSGSYSLASLSGNGVIIFAYEGGGNGGTTTTMQIDDIRIVNLDDPNCDNGGGEEPEPPQPPSGDAAPLFAGYDFEDWSTFLGGLNSFGIKSYANQSTGTGVDGSASLHILGTPTANDYVFTTFAPTGLTSSYSKVTFYMKGTSAKSVSLNLYIDDTTYYKFNLGTITSSTTIQDAGNNQYTGTINTNGEWVQITLDLSGINDLNVSNTSGNLFALKVGKDAAYDLHFDNFTIE